MRSSMVVRPRRACRKDKMSKAKKQSEVPEISIVIPVYNEEGICLQAYPI